MKLIRDIVDESLKVKEHFFADQNNMSAIIKAVKFLKDALKAGGKILVFGNGGSASDSQHMAAELMVRFEKERQALACIALSTDTSILTAVSNDYNFNISFSRQVEALIKPLDVVFAISTSGNSENVIEAVKTAREKGNKIIVLTGRDGGKLLDLSDAAIVVRSEKTARVQETHIVIIHIICKMVEDAFTV